MGRWRRLLAMTAFLIAAAIIALPNPTYIHRFLESERHLNALTLGAGIEAGMSLQAARIMNGWFVETGIYQKSMAMADTRNGQIPMNWEKITSWLQDRLMIIWSITHVIIYRFFGFVVWLPFLGGLMVATSLDAWLTREKNKWRFTFTSPLKHAAGAKSAAWSVFAVGVALIFPFTVPAIIPPILMLVIMVGSWVMVSNLHKRL